MTRVTAKLAGLAEDGRDPGACIKDGTEAVVPFPRRLRKP